jgi:DNA-binding LacI/PurR family transcriptional regulator
MCLLPLGVDGSGWRLLPCNCTVRRFTALLAFNDMSAIGAIRAFCDAGYSIPGDISVVGFDDVQTAAYQNPRLTTVRQPLRRMGEAAAISLLERTGNPGIRPREILVTPELIVRESTAGPVRDSSPAISELVSTRSDR